MTPTLSLSALPPPLARESLGAVLLPCVEATHPVPAGNPGPRFPVGPAPAQRRVGGLFREAHSNPRQKRAIRSRTVSGSPKRSVDGLIPSAGAGALPSVQAFAASGPALRKGVRGGAS